MINMKPFLIIAFLFLYSNFIYSQTAPTIQVETLDTTDIGAGTQQVIDWVLGKLHGGGGDFPDSTSTGIHFIGNRAAFGWYWQGDGLNGVGSGMDTGLILSNGRVYRAEFPNSNGYMSDYFQTPGDEELKEMYDLIFQNNGSGLQGGVPLDTTSDAAVLEFLYRPYGDTITLRYVYASEEYQFKRPADDQYTDFTGYSGHPDQMYDIFGIHIDHQSKPFKNLALLPPIACPDQDASCWASLYTINHNKNSGFYIGNGVDDGPTTGNTFDGQTNNSNALVIRKVVNPCGIYRIKVAIEDFWFVSPDEEQFSSGGHINSAIFLGGGSLTGGKSNPTWTTEYSFEGTGANDPDFEGQLIEGGCRDMLVKFVLNSPVSSIDSAYDIPFRINSEIFRDSIIITYADGSPLYSDSVIFHPGETEKTIRVSVGNIGVDHANVKFTWPIDPCEKPRPPFLQGTFSEFIPFTIRDNSPIEVSVNPKIYEAYCKDIVDVSIVDETSGGVSPLTYIWPGNPIPPVEVYSQQVNNTPEIVNVKVVDGCDNETSSVVQINNLPIIFNQIQSIFLCGPGQQATVPVTTIKPDSPDYSIDNVVWERSAPPPVEPKGDQPGDQITVVYDDFVGDAVWTCQYTVTDVCGASGTSDFEVNQSSLTLNNEGICLGDQVSLFTGTPANWYKWYKMLPPNDSILIGTNQQEYDNPTSTSIYKLWIEDNCGEVQAATMTVFVDDYTPQISLVPNDGEICNGETITLTASNYVGAEGNVTYEWSNGKTDKEITVALGEYVLGLNQFYVNTQHDYLPYYLCDNNASAEFTVFENPSPDFAIDPSEHACTNTDVAFDYLSDTTDNRTFAWDFGDSQTGNQPYMTHQYSSAGNYDVNLYVEHTYAPNGHVCNNEITKPLTVDPLPEPDFSADVGCIPVMVYFTDNSQEILPGATYDWTFGDGGTDNIQNPNHQYTEAGLFSIKLVIHNTERCFAEINKPNYIQANPNPTAGFDADPWITTMDTPLIDFINQSESDSTLTGFEWDFGDGNTSSDENPSHTFAAAGNYEISLRVETTNGCWDTTFAVVALTEYVQLFIPTAFTP
ncbi:MAG: PKD domain-containing protein, partial [Chlorobi bacterium]|nr:PKD domain-containing protein [Chlorobiota bacterium]